MLGSIVLKMECRSTDPGEAKSFASTQGGLHMSRLILVLLASLISGMLESKTEPERTSLPGSSDTTQVRHGDRKTKSIKHRNANERDSIDLQTPAPLPAQKDSTVKKVRIPKNRMILKSGEGGPSDTTNPEIHSPLLRQKDDPSER